MFAALKVGFRNSTVVRCVCVCVCLAIHFSRFPSHLIFRSLSAVNYRRPKFSGPFSVSLKMSSKIICSNLSNIDVTKPQKNAVKASSRNAGNGVDKCEDIEEMTLQQIKSKLSDVAAKGSKHGLVSDLRSRMNDEGSSAQDKVMDEKMPTVTKTYSKRKAKELPERDNVQIMNKDSDISGVKTTKKRVKQSSVDATDLKTLQSTSGQELITESTETKEETSLRGKRKASSRVTTSTKVITNVDSPVKEPWTVLTHKKPQKGWISYNPKTMRPSPIDNNTANVKLMSWNVNGLRALLKLEGFSALQLAQRENFDVLCLQETKLQEKDVEAIRQKLLEGYDNSYWSCSVSKLGYSGTAIISRIKPLSVTYGLGIPDHDSEGRLVTVEFDKFYLLSSYVPNSGDGLKRLPYRVTQWDPSLSSYMKDLERSKPVILTGDLNCAHQEIDIYNPAGNKRSAGFTDEERQSFQKNFLDKGFVDTFRKQHPDVVGYTYWGYRHGGRKTNRGWRLDYFLASESIADNVYDSYILPDIGGSDHGPIGLILKL